VHSALLACFSSHTFSRATMLQDDVLSFHCLARQFSRPERFFFCFVFFWVTGELSTLRHDEGTERTWFEPEQRPRKRVPKRSVHGKQSPQGASKMSWRQDDQPERSATCRSTCALHGHAYGCTYHVSCVTRLTHMCHDITGPAIIMAGRLGTRIFCLPLVGIACHGLIA